MEQCRFTLVVPSLDPDDKLSATIHAAVDAGIDDIVLIDDGSSEENRHWFEELAELPQVTLLTHPKNLGKGAALKTAFAWFLENRKDRDGVVTADGDGQHQMEDVIACADEMTRGEPAVILGCRDFTLPDVPPKSRFGNQLTCGVFRLMCGMKISDTQTGLRAIPAQYLELMLAVKGTRYEYETNMLLTMGEKKIPYREVKIRTIYYEENRASHFRAVRDSIRVYGLILKYAASSMFSAVLDLFLFFLFSTFLFRGDTQADVFACTVSARVLSALANFAVNRRLVFDSQAGAARTLVRYVCLAVPIMLASWLMVYFLSSVLMIHSSLLRTLIKLPVDVLLFLVSFRVQRAWVFAGEK